MPLPNNYDELIPVLEKARSMGATDDQIVETIKLIKQRNPSADFTPPVSKTSLQSTGISQTKPLTSFTPEEKRPDNPEYVQAIKQRNLSDPNFQVESVKAPGAESQVTTQKIGESRVGQAIQSGVDAFKGATERAVEGVGEIKGAFQQKEVLDKRFADLDNALKTGVISKEEYDIKKAKAEERMRGVTGEAVAGAAGVVRAGAEGVMSPLTGAITGGLKPEIEKVGAFAGRKFEEMEPEKQQKLQSAIAALQEFGDENPALRDVAMTALEVAGMTKGLGFAEQAGSQALKVGKKVGEELIEEGAQQLSKSVPNAIKSTTQFTKEAGESLRKVPEAIRESRKAKVVKSRVDELTKLQQNNAPLRKVIQSAEKKGIDVKKKLSETDLLRGAVDRDGTIRTEIAIDSLNEFIRPQEDVISKNLIKEGRKVSLSQVERELKEAINKSGVKGGAKIRALKNVDDDISGYSLDADEFGNISIATLHDAKVDKYANINYLNPESQRVDKTIAKKLKEIVEKNTDSINVKELNQELSNWYAVQNLLEKLNGKKVAGGRLGKYFAQGIGAVVGSNFGPIGAVVGGELGGFIKGARMASKFGGKTDGALKISSSMKNALENASKFENKTPSIQKLLPAPKEGALKSSINQPINLGPFIKDEPMAKVVGTAKNQAKEAVKKKIIAKKAKSVATAETKGELIFNRVENPNINGDYNFGRSITTETLNEIKDTTIKKNVKFLSKEYPDLHFSYDRNLKGGSGYIVVSNPELYYNIGDSQIAPVAIRIRISNHGGSWRYAGQERIELNYGEVVTKKQISELLQKQIEELTSDTVNLTNSKKNLQMKFIQ